LAITSYKNIIAGLKLDYYKTVWFKRLREGSIDVRNLSNGAALTSDEEDDEDVPYHVLKFGEHLDASPVLQTAQQLGAKVLRIILTDTALLSKCTQILTLKITFLLLGFDLMYQLQRNRSITTFLC